MENKMVCCICGKEIENKYDNNNPWPIREYSELGTTENRCCGECNNRFVVPARIAFMSAKLTEKEAENSAKILATKSYDELVELFPAK